MFDPALGSKKSLIEKIDDPELGITTYRAICPTCQRQFVSPYRPVVENNYLVHRSTHNGGSK